MYYDNNTIIFLDGKWINASDGKTDLYSQTLHYGSGVFEGIRSYKSQNGVSIFKAKEHYERLHYSAKKMHIEIKYSVEELTKLTYQLLEKNQLGNAYIRPIVFQGANMSLQPCDESHLAITAWEWGKLLGDTQLRVMTSSFQRPNPKSCFVDAKVTGHYTNSILATTEAKQKGYDEALLLDMNGNVAEGPGANFFYEKNNRLITCPVGNILPGITRNTILELAVELNIEVEEKFFRKEEVYQADSAFFTGTAAEVIGIESLDNTKFKLNWKDTLGYKLSKAYNKRVINQI